VRLEFDLETDGFLDVMTRIHCMVVKDADTGEVFRFTEGGQLGCAHLEIGVRMLMEADEVWGHNILKFDLPALLKIFPWFVLKASCVRRDTMVLSRLIWASIKERDIKAVKRGFPGKLVGKHSLEAWGHRLGNYKGDFKGPWDTLTQEMLDYCVQDIEVTDDLRARIEKKQYAVEATELEHEVQRIIATQEQFGFCFNTAKAAELYARLSAKRDELTARLKAAFPAWEVRTPFTPKANNKARGYVKGVPTFKVKVIEFNPASRDHIADRLTTLYGWKPMQFTDGGKPQVDESTLSPLKYPTVPLLMEYLLVEKRIGQLAEGKEAWLKHVKNGRIHGAVNPMGAVTGRMSHFFPNVAQVPKVGSPYGEECRELFEVPPGFKLVGADAAGLELRCLAHYLAKWDEGAYARAVIEGKQEDKSDVHSLTALALGLEPQQLYTLGGKTGKGRDFAKTFIYAFLYGAGDEKLGSIVGKGAGAGRQLKKAFIEKIPGMKALRKAVEIAAKRGYLVGLDGRHIHVRSSHAALNSLLQGAGAIVMKKALVILDAALTARGLIRFRDYSFVANIHDEFQIQVKEELANEVGRLAVQSIRDAGSHFKFRCPLDGEYKVGNNWKDTH
jgi:DNA polymerase-1